MGEKKWRQLGEFCDLGGAIPYENGKRSDRHMGSGVQKKENKSPVLTDESLFFSTKLDFSMVFLLILE